MRLSAGETVDHGLGAPRGRPAALDDAGLLLLGAGGALITWSIVLFRRAGTTHYPADTPTALVESGPYLPFLLVPAAFLLPMKPRLRPTRGAGARGGDR